MKQYSDYDDFSDLIREIIREEIKVFLAEEGFNRTIAGEVLDVTEDGKYDIDLVDTKVSGLLNKSGESLKKGDTVMVTEAYGSNYSNCYISTKNASSNSPTVNDLEGSVKTLEKNINLSKLDYSDLDFNTSATSGNWVKITVREGDTKTTYKLQCNNVSKVE
jgi:hypothetical protein